MSELVTHVVIDGSDAFESDMVDEFEYPNRVLGAFSSLTEVESFLQDLGEFREIPTRCTLWEVIVLRCDVFGASVCAVYAPVFDW